MSSFCKCKSYTHFFSKIISIYAIVNDQNFNDTLTNDIDSFEQLGPDKFLSYIFTNIIKALTALTDQLSLSVGWENGLEQGLKTVSFNP